MPAHPIPKTQPLLLAGAIGDVVVGDPDAAHATFVVGPDFVHVVAAQAVVGCVGRPAVCRRIEAADAAAGRLSGAWIPHRFEAGPDVAQAVAPDGPDEVAAQAIGCGVVDPFASARVEEADAAIGADP